MAAARDRLARLGRPPSFAWCGSTWPACVLHGYLPGGQRVLIRGRVTSTQGGGLEIGQPEIHPLAEGEPPRIRPVYRLPALVGQRLFADLVARTLAQLNARGAIPDETPRQDSLDA